MEYSKDQELALQKMEEWWKLISDDNNHILKANQVFYLAGWAGTGKTTIADVFSSSLPEKTKIFYGSYTGKAALRMRQAGMKNAQTLHSMIYRPYKDKDGKLRFEINGESKLWNADLLMLDECSMVDKTLGDDIISFNVPILILGDKGQLPPIKGQGFFTNRKPNATLNKVHRQALENPIIELATNIRLHNGIIKRYNEPNLITFPKHSEYEELMYASEQTLCGKNKTRMNLNKKFRSALGFDKVSEYPVTGDRIICLRNNKAKNIFNGLIGTEHHYAKISEMPNGSEKVTLSFCDEEDNEYNIYAHPIGFTDEVTLAKMDYDEKKYLNEFTWGYAITGHKSQGSQWDDVFIFDDNFLVWDRPNRIRWLYTCVTRAAEKLILYKGKI